MGVNAYFVAHALLIVVSQRFARRLCACKVEGKLSQEVLELWKPPANATFFDAKPKGCSRCQRKGYKGRIAMMEVLSMTEGLKQGIVAGKAEDMLVDIAIKNGMDTLFIDGLRKCAQGITSTTEVLRVIGGIASQRKKGPAPVLGKARVRHERTPEQEASATDSAVLRARRPSAASRVNRQRPNVPSTRPRGLPPRRPPNS
ncbi:MAG: hypothetical protein P1V97_18560 [Planctomycetota bacterium]|nr:hypothetical protein [Planctomycetota bacterium]